LFEFPGFLFGFHLDPFFSGKWEIQIKNPGNPNKNPGNPNKNPGNPNKNLGNPNKKMFLSFFYYIEVFIDSEMRSSGY
jgi:hypothetical protein